MSMEKRSRPAQYGKKVSLGQSAELVKAITETIPIDKVLDQSPTLWYIPCTAGNLAGIKTQLEGNYAAKGIISAAYENIFQILEPSRNDLTPERLQKVIRSKDTLRTLATLAASLSTSGMSKGVLGSYEREGAYLQRENNDITIADSSCLDDDKLLSRRGGCPYAAAEKGAELGMFYKLAIRAGDTYAAAIERDMPRTRIELARRAFGKLFT